MAIVDRDGRMFGRINVIDAAIVVAALLAIPVSIAAYRVFSVRHPMIEKIEPPSLAFNGDRRLRLEGSGFRPYLRAFFFASGQPFSLRDPEVPDSGQNEATVRVDTPSSAELTLPPGPPPGTYDLYLYDTGQEVAKRMSAFTIARPDEPPPGPARIEVVEPIEIVVRFQIDPAIADLMKTGDVAVAEDKWPGRPAVLASLRTVPPPPETYLQLGTARLSVSPSGTVITSEGVVRLEASRTRGVWHTAAVPRIRAGEEFPFATAGYAIKGIVTRLTALAR